MVSESVSGAGIGPSTRLIPGSCSRTSECRVAMCVCVMGIVRDTCVSISACSLVTHQNAAKRAMQESLPSSFHPVMHEYKHMIANTPVK